MNKFRSLFIFTILFILPLQASSAFVYQYTGNNYVGITDSTVVSGMYTTNMRLTGEFEVDSQIFTSNLSDVSTSIASYSFTDGRIILNEENSYIDTFNIQTNALGDITSWEINVETDFPEITSVGDQEYSFITNSSQDVIDIVFIFQCDGLFIDQSNCFSLKFDSAGIRDNQGAWEIIAQPIPVPAAIWFFGSSMIVLYKLGRKRSWDFK